MPKLLPWDEQKDELYSLYIVQNRTLKDIIAIMGSEHKFYARYYLLHSKYQNFI